ncbi:TPA: phage integrase [Morganella morganii]
MALTKQPYGQWRLDFYPEGKKNGVGKRIRKTFSTKGEALAYERFILENTDNRPWIDGKEDRRTLKNLVDIWFGSHGVTLDDEERRKSTMYFASDSMGSPLACEFTAQLFTVYREKRLSGKIARTSRLEKVSPRTMNLELSYFRAMFNKLTRMGQWPFDNPVNTIRAFKTEETEMAFLTADEIDLLLSEYDKSSSVHLSTVVKVCLSTEARWSEAEGLKNTNISKYRITYIKTKGNRNRTVPISQVLYDLLPKNKGALFSQCYYAFRSALNRTDIELPDGQLSYVLRHTFASHFMMNGGNILVLQRILGHTDIKMTMRYAHFAPDHLNDAVMFNPLVRLKI